MQLKYLTLVPALLLVIGSLIHVPGWLFLSEWCLRRLLPPIHRCGVADVIFSRLWLNYLELDLIMADRTTLPW
jgi:hypothetical protein